MIILAYGIPQPTTGDRGSVFFPALEQVIQRFAAHNHDGNNTSLISAAFSQIGSVLCPIVSWTLVSPGVYSQTVNLPTNFLYDNCEFETRRTDNFEKVYAQITRVSNTQITVTTSRVDKELRVYVK